MQYIHVFDTVNDANSYHVVKLADVRIVHIKSKITVFTLEIEMLEKI